MVSVELTPEFFRFEPPEEVKKAINDTAERIMKKASEHKDSDCRYIGIIGRSVEKIKDSEPCEFATEFCELPTTDRVREIITLQKQLMANYIKNGVDPNKAAQCTSYTIWAYLGAGDIVIESGDDRD